MNFLFVSDESMRSIRELLAKGGPACQGREALGCPHADAPEPPSGPAVARGQWYRSPGHPCTIPGSTHLGINHLVGIL